MPIKIQIAFMDKSDYILGYKDFKPDQIGDINIYVWECLTKPSTHKIEIKKWN